MHNDTISNNFNFLKDSFALQISYFNLCNEYYSLYTNGFLSEFQKGIDNSFYERWISNMDKKLDEKLRSEEFLGILSNFLVSLSRIIKDSKYYGLDKLIEEIIDFNLDKYILDNLMFIHNIDKNKHDGTNYKIIGKIDSIEIINFIDENRKTNDLKPVSLGICSD